MGSKQLALLRVDYYKKIQPSRLFRESETDVKGKSNVKIQGSKHPKLFFLIIIPIDHVYFYNP
jgi:hypothetical protein